MTDMTEDEIREVAKIFGSRGGKATAKMYKKEKVEWGKKGAAIKEANRLKKMQEGVDK